MKGARNIYSYVPKKGQEENHVAKGAVIPEKYKKKKEKSTSDSTRYKTILTLLTETLTKAVPIWLFWQETCNKHKNESSLQILHEFIRGSGINLILSFPITKEKHSVKVLEGFLFDQGKSDEFFTQY